MLSKRILVLVFVVAFVTLLVGCFTVPTLLNEAPTITSTPIITATVGKTYTYDVNATDSNGDALTYSLDVKPTGMAINPATGLIIWTPTAIGGSDVTVVVSDGVLSDIQEFNISVTARTPMEITVDLPTFTVNGPYWFTVNMVANSDEGKSVVASFEWPTSAVSGPIEGTLEIEEGSDLDFVQTGSVFKTGVFIMEDVTAKFRGTFIKEGTYSTTIEVRTFPGGVLLCSKYIKIVVEPEVRYSFTDKQPVSAKPDGTVGELVTTVTEDGDWMVWTFDFPVEEFTGDGNLNVGLIIALDGEGKGPAFQIHNNDGTDSSYGWGTWLMSPYDNGWHSNYINTPVTDLDWVEATGNRNVPHGDGVMQIKIKISELGNAFHWAASPTVGSGFSNAYDVTMQIPADFDWGTPLVNMSILNYIAR